jgi:hypothetical protein
MCDCTNLAYNVPFKKYNSTGILNPQAYKNALGFISSPSTCSKNSVTTYDARLFDNKRAMQLCLDTEPYDGSVWMDDVYKESKVPRSYGKNYSSYESITPGQIQYYIDKDVAPAFRKQIYNLPGDTVIDQFVTPMGKVEPMFYLKTYQRTFNNLSKDSFARDQLLFRNELISLQQRGHNKVRYEAIK